MQIQDIQLSQNFCIFFSITSCVYCTVDYNAYFRFCACIALWQFVKRKSLIQLVYVYLQVIIWQVRIRMTSSGHCHSVYWHWDCQVLHLTCTTEASQRWLPTNCHFGPISVCTLWFGIEDKVCAELCGLFLFLPVCLFLSFISLQILVTSLSQATRCV